MPKWTRRSRPGRLNPKITERQGEYFEKVLQPEIVAESEVLAREQEKRIQFFTIKSLLCLALPGNVEIIPEWSEDRLLLKLATRILEIWLDHDDERMISIGSHDYYLHQEGKLIEVEAHIFDLIPRRKYGSKDYALTQDGEDKFILDLSIIEGNEKIAQFFAK